MNAVLPRRSLIVPVYRNESSLPALLDAVRVLAAQSPQGLELVIVVDGSPDGSLALLECELPRCPFPSQLISHARNFGSYAAIRTGMRHARGEMLAVMAADLQEPPELMLEFWRILEADAADVVLGARERRDDPWSQRLLSELFWAAYRRLVQPDLPPGGVDVFGCNRRFAQELLALEEARSSMIGQIFWLGFRRQVVPYHRRARHSGRSAWSFRRKLDYLLDSVYAFTDLPLRLLTAVGVLGVGLAIVAGGVVLIGRLLGWITVPGYTPIVLAICFFGSLNLIGLGVVGSYLTRAYENSKRRPLALVERARCFAASSPGERSG